MAARKLLLPPHVSERLHALSHLRSTGSRHVQTERPLIPRKPPTQPVVWLRQSRALRVRAESWRRGMAANAGADNKKAAKTVVVTGVTRGLGRALAAELASRGHTVAGCGRSEGRLKQLQGELGDRHLLMAADVASEKSVEEFAAAVMSKLGVPDIIINSAGLINANARLWEVPAAEFDAVVDVNVKGTANVLRHFLPAMVQRRAGTVVNFSSGWGRSAAAEVGPYCATKWAVEGLTKSLAKELPPGMAAVALNPGVVNTDMLRSCFGASASMYTTPESWAPHCASLILGLSPSDNGSSLTV